jgi:hypothetical protein
MYTMNIYICQLKGDHGLPLDAQGRPRHRTEPYFLLYGSRNSLAELTALIRFDHDLRRGRYLRHSIDC